MLSLSQTTGYAVLALACMEGPSGSPILVRDVAKAASIPKPYLSKLIHALAQRGLVTTKRGYKGGVVLARDPEQISLLEIAEAVEGSEWLDRCVLGLEECSDERACPMHEHWKPTRASIRAELENINLATVAEFEMRRQTIRPPSEVSGNNKPGQKPGETA